MKIERVLLVFLSLLYLAIIFSFLSRDVRYFMAMAYGIGDKADIESLPIAGFSRIKTIGFIVLELGVILSVIFLNVKINKLTFILLTTFSAPLLLGLLYYELRNKTMGFDFYGKHWLIIIAGTLIFCLLLFSNIFSSRINLSIKQYLLLTLLIILVGTFYIVII